MFSPKKPYPLIRGVKLSLFKQNIISSKVPIKSEKLTGKGSYKSASTGEENRLIEQSTLTVIIKINLKERPTSISIGRLKKFSFEIEPILKHNFGFNSTVTPFSSCHHISYPVYFGLKNGIIQDEQIKQKYEKKWFFINIGVVHGIIWLENFVIWFRYEGN